MFEYSNQTVNWQTRNEVIETKKRQIFYLRYLISCVGTTCHREFFVQKLQYFLSFKYI